MKSQNIVAIPEGNASAGAIVWWRLTGTVDATLLAAAWAKAGLPEGDLPDLPGYEVALRRALNEQRGHRRLVRPLGFKGWAIVSEKATDKTVAHATICTVWLGLDGRPTVEFNVNHPEAGPEIEQQLNDGYDRHLSELSREDISSWLVWHMHQRFKAVPLRDSGGVYFVPNVAMEHFDKLRASLQSASKSKIGVVPALTNADAVESVLDALRCEAEAEAAGMEEELMNGELGERALSSRATRCRSVVEKIGVYEKLLGSSLDDLRSRLGDLESGLAAAALAVTAEVA